jgi:hypothetical protein
VCERVRMHAHVRARASSISIQNKKDLVSMVVFGGGTAAYTLPVTCDVFEN